MAVENMMIEVVKLGFHGAAIAMACLSYMLLRSAFASEASEGSKNLSLILREVRLFMGLSFTLLVVGVGAQIYTNLLKREASANVIVSPVNFKDFERLVSVRHGNDSINVRGGPAPVQLKDKDNIMFNIELLVSEMNELSMRNNVLLSTRTPGGGFGK